MRRVPAPRDPNIDPRLYEEDARVGTPAMPDMNLVTEVGLPIVGESFDASSLVRT
jgi:hypothetical protein